MNTKLITVFIFVIVMLVGCGSSQKRAEKTPVKDHLVEYVFEVDQNYQAVYRHILSQARACVKPVFTGKMIVYGELFSDIKAADIAVALKGFFSENRHLQIKIEEAANNKTKVEVSNKFRKWNAYARAVKAWVVDKSTACEVPEL